MSQAIPLFAIIMLVLTTGFGMTQYSHAGIANLDDTTEVPLWIKTSMGYWVDGQTSDTEFLNAVEFLANEKIISGAVLPRSMPVRCSLWATAADRRRISPRRCPHIRFR